MNINSFNILSDNRKKHKKVISSKDRDRQWIDLILRWFCQQLLKWDEIKNISFAFSSSSAYQIANPETVKKSFWGVLFLQEDIIYVVIWTETYWKLQKNEAEKIKGIKQALFTHLFLVKFNWKTNKK